MALEGFDNGDGLRVVDLSDGVDARRDAVCAAFASKGSDFVFTVCNQSLDDVFADLTASLDTCE